MVKKMGRNKAYDRETVLEKAMDLFWRKGFEGAHLQELVDYTGLNRFSLYKEFGGKEGLFEAAVNRYLLGLQEVGSLLRREPRGMGNILDYISEIIRSDFSKGCFMINTLTQQEVINEKIRVRIKDFVFAARDLLIENFSAAQKKGEIRPNDDVHALANFLSVLDIGLVTFSLVDPTSEEKEKIFGVLKDFFSSTLGYEPAKQWTHSNKYVGNA